MAAPINAAAVAALADEVIDWRFKGLPAAWWRRTPAQICVEEPDLFDGGITGSADWCRGRDGVLLAISAQLVTPSGTKYAEITN